MSFFPFLPTKGNKFALNAVLLKCFQTLGVNNDTNNNNYYCYSWRPHFDAENVLIKTEKTCPFVSPSANNTAALLIGRLLFAKKIFLNKVSRKEANNSKTPKYVDGLPVHRRPWRGTFSGAREAETRERVVRSLGGRPREGRGTFSFRRGCGPGRRGRFWSEAVQPGV